MLGLDFNSKGSGDTQRFDASSLARKHERRFVCSCPFSFSLLLCLIVCLFVCLFDCLFAYLFICLFDCLVVCLFGCLLACLQTASFSIFSCDACRPDVARWTHIGDFWFVLCRVCV